MEIIPIFENFGLPVAVIIALMAALYKLYNDMQLRNVKHEEHVERLIQGFSGAIDRNTEALRKMDEENKNYRMKMLDMVTQVTRIQKRIEETYKKKQEVDSIE